MDQPSTQSVGFKKEHELEKSHSSYTNRGSIQNLRNIRCLEQFRAYTVDGSVDRNRKIPVWKLSICLVVKVEICLPRPDLTCSAAATHWPTVINYGSSINWWSSNRAWNQGMKYHRYDYVKVISLEFLNRRPPADSLHGHHDAHNNQGNPGCDIHDRSLVFVRDLYSAAFHHHYDLIVLWFLDLLWKDKNPENDERSAKHQQRRFEYSSRAHIFIG